MGTTVNLGRRFERLADYLISIGRFENRSEVLRHAMRLLEEDEYTRGYIHKDKEFSALFSVHARLRQLQREKDYPSINTIKDDDGGFTSEILSMSEKIVDSQLEDYAIQNRGAPLARDDPRPNRETRGKPRESAIKRGQAGQ